MLHLSGVADMMFNKVSSGQQKLALIARALIKRPDLLILDEPMHGLDAARKRALLAMIDHVCNHTGMAASYVTHYQNEQPASITPRQTLPTWTGRLKKA